MSHDPAAVAAAMQCLDDFMAAFNARDIDAWQETFNFPSVRLASGTLADEGTVVDRFGENTSVKIDRADIRFNWEARQRALIIPFQIQSGGNQFTLRAALEAPADQNGVWLLSVARGDPVIDPVILASAGKSDEEGIALNRVAVRARIDTARRRIDLDQGDFSRIDTRPLYNIAVAVTGSLDYSGTEPGTQSLSVRSLSRSGLRSRRRESRWSKERSENGSGCSARVRR